MGTNKQQSRDKVMLIPPLTSRDQQLLDLLLYFPLMRASELRLLLGLQEGTLYRSLSHLRQAALIETVRSPVLGRERSQCYHLSRQGLALLAAQRSTEPPSLAAAWGTGEEHLLELFPRLSSLMPLYRFLAHMLAPVFASRQETTSIQQEQIWQWKRDARLQGERFGSPFSSQLSGLLSLPAASCTTRHERTHEQRHHLLILVDSQLTSSAFVTQWLKRVLWYRATLLSGGGLLQWGVQGQQQRREEHMHQKPGSLPPILVLTAQSHRLEIWGRCLKMVLSQLDEPSLLLAMKVFSPSLFEQGSTEREWWQKQWWRLDTAVFTTLPQILETQKTEQGKHFPLIWEPVRRETREEPGADNRREKALAYVRRLLQARASLAHLSHVGRLASTLSRQDLLLIQQIEKHPFVSTQELAAFLHVHPDSVTRYASALKQHQVVQRAGDLAWWAAFRPLSSPDPELLKERWLLTETGLRLLAASAQVPLGHLALPTTSMRKKLGDSGKTDASMPMWIARKAAQVIMRRRFLHQIGLYEILHQFNRLSRLNEEGRVHWWEFGATHPHFFEENREWKAFRPDIEMAYQVQKAISLRLWIAYLPYRLTREAQGKTYRAYCTSLVEQQESQLKTIVLFVVQTQEEERRFLQNIRAINETATFPCGITTLGSLRRVGAVGAIWVPMSGCAPQWSHPSAHPEKIQRFPLDTFHV